MPPQKSTATGFLNKMRNSAFAKHIGQAAKKEINYGPEDLPAGIRAVCRLIDIGLKEYPPDTKMKTIDDKSAAGSMYFMARATIVEPETFVYPDGVERKIAGKQVTLRYKGMPNIPCIATKTKASPPKITSEEENCEAVMMEIGKLSSSEYIADASSVEDVVALCEGLKHAKPVFNFNTTVKPASKGQDGKEYPAGVSEWWNGNRGLENYHAPDAQDITTNDDTGGGGNEGEKQDEPDDLDAIFAAVEDDTHADHEFSKARMVALCKAIGIEEGNDDGSEPGTIAAAKDWAEVRGWIEAGGLPKDDEKPKAEEVPVKDTVCKYPVKNAKSKKTEMLDHNIVSVDKTKKTVVLKQLGQKNLTKDVPWSDLDLS